MCILRLNKYGGNFCFAFISLDPTLLLQISELFLLEDRGEGCPGICPRLDFEQAVWLPETTMNTIATRGCVPTEQWFSGQKPLKLQLGLRNGQRA